jgi:multiple sugar transport system ATP-binding protein
MVYVTHDQIEAMSLADRIAIIDKGKLMQYGTPLEVYNNPQNRFVANFVGSPRMNLMDGELRQERGELCLMMQGGAAIPVKGAVRKAFEASTGVYAGTLAIRPQDIHFDRARNTNGAELRGTVEVVERVGPKRLVHLQVLATTFLAFDEQDQFSVGDDVSFYLPSDKSLAFDLESGRRLGGIR